MSVEDAHREHLLTEAMNRLKSDNEIVGFNHGTCESMEMNSQEIKEAQESFIDDPADSEYQRGYLIAINLELDMRLLESGTLHLIN